jgi:hypothetical protein
MDFIEDVIRADYTDDKKCECIIKNKKALITHGFFIILKVYFLIRPYSIPALFPHKF